MWSEDHLSTLQTTLGAELMGAGTFFEKLRTSSSPIRPRSGSWASRSFTSSTWASATRASRPSTHSKHCSTCSRRRDGASRPLGDPRRRDCQLRAWQVYRDAYVRFLLKLARAAKEEVRNGRAEDLQDPWRFRDVVAGVRTSTDGLEANAVLHACFPDEFDVMISGGHRDKLLRRFGGAPLVSDADDEEHKLLAVREVLADRVPEPIDEPYDDAVRATWDGPASPEWDDLVRRALPLLPEAPDQDGAPRPPVDADLLERLQHAVGLRRRLGRTPEGGRRARRRRRRRRPLLAGARDRAAGGRRQLPSAARPTPRADVRAAAPLPPITTQLAADLLLPQSWLQSRLDLLAYPAPGHPLRPAGDGQDVPRPAARPQHAAPRRDGERLVQFHPSYTYEDFFEGYRPESTTTAAADATSSCRARSRLVAERGERPGPAYVLIIDEINRGNLPKIFGELLLPARVPRRADRAAVLARRAQFALPQNLFFIGTMNTADRSIALVDAALRRRFDFIELSPNAEPVRDLLRKWLRAPRASIPSPRRCSKRLNAMLLEADGDADFAIGPSYFMNERGGVARPRDGLGDDDPARCSWSASTARRATSRQEFGLDAVQAEVARRADVTDADEA